MALQRTFNLRSLVSFCAATVLAATPTLAQDTR
jgi:hypothetical protein